jgi:UDP-GlcNAc:undecaprenyl-phosphate GlcNAc-1-phosphate transferase
MTAFWVALAVALLLTGALIPVLRRAGLFDMPNDRSSHETPTPRGGGVAVLIAVLVAVSAAGDAAREVYLPVAAAVVLAVVGMVDDVRSLSSRVRLAAQVLVAVLAAFAVARTADQHVGLPLLVAIGTLGVVGYVNAFNFMDGVNAISGLNAGLVGLWFVWLGQAQDAPPVELMGAVLAGAALGFLPWNVHGRIFLGDVGSYGFGALISVTALLAWAAGIPPLLVLAPVAIYLTDTGWVIATRAWSQQRLTEAHRDHVYQLLVLGGWTHLAAAGWTASFAALVCLAVATLHEQSSVVAGLGVLIVAAAYLLTPRWQQRATVAQPSPGGRR